MEKAEASSAFFGPAQRLFGVAGRVVVNGEFGSLLLAGNPLLQVARQMLQFVERLADRSFRLFELVFRLRVLLGRAVRVFPVHCRALRRRDLGKRADRKPVPPSSE